jgi:hypothetical protein
LPAAFGRDGTESLFPFIAINDFRGVWRKSYLSISARTPAYVAKALTAKAPESNQPNGPPPTKAKPNGLCMSGT